MARDAIKILIVDDHPVFREGLRQCLESRKELQVLATVGGGDEMWKAMRAHGRPQIVLMGVEMPGTGGIELTKALHEKHPEVRVIMLTAFGTVEEAVQAMKDGAYDFLTKPFQRAQLIRLIRKALERRALIAENRALQQRLDDLLRQGAVIGTSPAFQRMMMLIEQVAPSSATVLIQGESGAGKELAARAIHERSARRAGPFVAVNCAALPQTLLESELFGYEKGAFTGAAGRKEGRFELADGGTLFLDEVADLSPVTQPKILRVLQEGEFERVGGTKTLRVDVRIVTATNQDLAQLIREKRFREDLYYRLNVITITVPPLRERREDIPLLAHHFLRVYAAKNNRRLDTFNDEALARLEAYAWPGNVRELENAVERAVVLARGNVIQVSDLPTSVLEGTAERVVAIPIGTPLAEVEQRFLEATLRHTKGNRTLAAKLLGIDPKTVFRKLKQAGPEEAGPEDDESTVP